MLSLSIHGRRGRLGHQPVDDLLERLLLRRALAQRTLVHAQLAMRTRATRGNFADALHVVQAAELDRVVAHEIDDLIDQLGERRRAWFIRSMRSSSSSMPTWTCNPQIIMRRATPCISSSSAT